MTPADPSPTAVRLSQSFADALFRAVGYAEGIAEAERQQGIVPFTPVAVMACAGVDAPEATAETLVAIDFAAMSPDQLAEFAHGLDASASQYRAVADLYASAARAIEESHRRLQLLFMLAVMQATTEQGGLGERVSGLEQKDRDRQVVEWIIDQSRGDTTLN